MSYRRRRYYGKRKPTTRYTKRKSRYGGRKYVKRKMKASVRRAGMFMSDRYFTRLKYNHFTTITDNISGQGYYATTIYRGNGLFDPEQQVGGQQPLGYDQLTSFYQRYRVYACKLFVRVHSLGGTGTTPYYVAVVPFIGTTYAATPWITDIAEQPYTRFKTRNQYDSNPSIKHCMSTAKIYGVNKSTIKNDDLFSSPVSTLPTNQWSYLISIGNLNQAASASTNYMLELSLTYYCEFYERRNLTRS